MIDDISIDKSVSEFLDAVYELSECKGVSIDMDAVKLALQYIIKYHANQKRHSGELYYHHPMAVALIAAGINYKTEIIVASLLHDIVEDTEFNIAQVQFLFGTTVADLVNKLTKLDDDITRKTKLAEENNLRKLFETEDLDAYYIKLADRLHNMRTLHYIKSKEKQKRIALDTLKIFIPLAKHAKIEWIEKELYTLASNIVEV